MADLGTQIAVAKPVKSACVLAALAASLMLGACAQVIGPMHSVYWWDGNVEDATEWYGHVKTTADRYEALEAHIRQHHPYDTPEIIATPIERGNTAYLTWVAAEARQA